MSIVGGIRDCPYLPLQSKALALIVDDGVTVGELVALSDTEGVTLGEAPKESVPLGVAVIVDERLIVVDPLSLPLEVCEAVGVAVLLWCVVCSAQTNAAKKCRKRGNIGCVYQCIADNS